LEARVTKSGGVLKVISADGAYVGLVDERGCLVELISRDRLLEQVARATLEKHEGGDSGGG
jgi:uncharacterized protein (UPF0297 family)